MADSLVKLKAPNGSTVRVSKERAEILQTQGYSSTDSKSASRKSSSSSSKSSK